jgi:hypothetical protein
MVLAWKMTINTMSFNQTLVPVTIPLTLKTNKAARAGKNCLVNAGDRLPCSSTWTKNLLGGHLTFGAISP